MLSKQSSVLFIYFRFTLHMHPYRGNGELLKGGTMNRDGKCRCSRGKTPAGCQTGAALQATKCTGMQISELSVTRMPRKHRPVMAVVAMATVELAGKADARLVLKRRDGMELSSFQQRVEDGPSEFS